VTPRHLEIFFRIEEVLEDIALARWITDVQKEPALGLEAAQEYYNSLDKQCGERCEGSGDDI
jgi:RelB Antitoxin alpha helical domain